MILRSLYIGIRNYISKKSCVQLDLLEVMGRVTLFHWDYSNYSNSNFLLVNIGHKYGGLTSTWDCFFPDVLNSTFYDNTDSISFPQISLQLHFQFTGWPKESSLCSQFCPVPLCPLVFPSTMDLVYTVLENQCLVWGEYLFKYNFHVQ